MREWLLTAASTTYRFGMIKVFSCWILPFSRRNILRPAAPYSAICYDPEENCFWAASRGCAAVLFQLTSCLKESTELQSTQAAGGILILQASPAALQAGPCCFLWATRRSIIKVHRYSPLHKLCFGLRRLADHFGKHFKFTLGAGFQLNHGIHRALDPNSWPI